MVPAFARLQNFTAQDASVTVELARQTPSDGSAQAKEQVINAAQVELAAGESKGVALDLGEMDSGVLRLRATTNDQLAVDDQAWAVVNPPRRAKVLLVTPGNDPLRFALGTESSLEVADVTFETPQYLDTEPYQQQAAGGKFDLVIYDRCQPKRLPQANTLFLGRLPPEGWAAEQRRAPQIIDVDPPSADAYVSWATYCWRINTSGTASLVASDRLADRPPVRGCPARRVSDAVLGFVLITKWSATTQAATLYRYQLADSPQLPRFHLQCLELSWRQSNRPGRQRDSTWPAILETTASNKAPAVRTPSGQTIPLKEGRLGRFAFTGTTQLGVYEVTGDKATQYFAVNLFQAAESNIRPRTEIKVGNVKVAGQPASVLSRREMWKLLLLGGLAVLLLEWYIYSRRVNV